MTLCRHSSPVIPHHVIQTMQKSPAYRNAIVSHLPSIEGFFYSYSPMSCLPNWSEVISAIEKERQNWRKARNRGKEFRGARDFILVLEPGAGCSPEVTPAPLCRRAETIWFHKFCWAKSFQSLILTWEQIYLLPVASLVNWSFKLESLSCHLKQSQRI